MLEHLSEGVNFQELYYTVDNAQWAEVPFLEDRTDETDPN